MTSGAESENKVLDDAKKVIRSLLLSTKYGLTVKELCSEYELIIGKPFPFREMGFSSPVDLVRAMPDVVRLNYQSGGAMLLRGIADESTQHIKDLVRGQKSTRRNTRLSLPKQIPVKQYKKTVPSFLKSKIQNLIKYYPHGIELPLFENAFLHQYDLRLNPQVQGFNSVTGLLEACSDIVKVQFKAGILFLHPIKKPDYHKRYPSKTAPPLITKYLTENNVLNDPKMNEKKKIDDKMKMQIFSVLVKRKNGMFSARFPFEYKAHHNCEFDLQSLGFNSVVELMTELPELVDITRPTEKGDFLLIPKNADKDTSNTNKIVDYTTLSPGKVNDNIEIYVSYIVDPSLFWIQVSSSSPQLYALMDEMTNFYHCDKEMKFNLPESSVLPGQPCAALYDDEQWYRAVIRDVLPNGIVSVYYVDYGNESEVHVSLVCTLKEEYMKLPCQAFKAKLSGVFPGNNSPEEKWSKESIEKFYELTCDQQLYARIVEKEPALSLDLVDFENNDIATMIRNEIKYIEVAVDSEGIQQSTENVINGYTPSEEKVDLTYKNLNPSLKASHIQGNDHLKSLPNSFVSNQFMSSEMDSDLIKCLKVSGNYTLHIIRYEGLPYILSIEISGLFWDVDVLRQMLHQKDADIESKFLLAREHGDIFSALEKYRISGMPDGIITKSILSIYQLSALPQIYSLFEPKFQSSSTIILSEIQIWNEIQNKEEYWYSASSRIPATEDRQTVETILKLQSLMFKRKRLQQMLFLEEHTATIK